MRIIVPTSAGGGTDMIARAIAQRLAAHWGQAVVVDNRPGATGSIGTEAAARAAPDGYTLLASTNAMLTINPHLYTRLAYDPLRDLAPVTLAASSPFLLVVHPALPVQSTAELIAYARSHPGQLNFSSSGNGSATHLAGVLFNSMAEIRIVHVPYKGGAPAITDLLGGQIQMRFSAILPVLQHVRAAKLRALAVSGTRRHTLFPDLPTVAATLPGYAADIWYGITAPAATPETLLARINADIVRELHTPEIRAKLEADGSEAVGNTRGEFATVIRAESERWARAVRESGVRPD